MLTQRPGGSAALAIVLAFAVFAGCPRSPFPGETEETTTKAKDVPVQVRNAALQFCERLGGARCAEWFWDAEDECWEVALAGLTRRAELDINPDGTFSELELVYDFAEVEQVLPDVAEIIRSRSREDPNVFIELSLRREEYLDEVPDLGRAWALTGVVIEFQCSNGQDFEMDAKGMCVTREVDDTTDSSTH